MVEVDDRIDPVDMARLRGAMDALVKNTGRNTVQAVAFTNVRIAESGRADSKPSRPQRKIEQNPLYSTAGRKKIPPHELAKAGPFATSYKFRVVYDFRTEKPYWYTSDKNDPHRVIGRRGLAKRMWNILAARAAATRGNTVQSREYTRFAMFANQNIVRSEIWNQLTYLGDAYPGQEGRIVQAASKKLDFESGAAADRAVQQFYRGR